MTPNNKSRNVFRNLLKTGFVSDGSSRCVLMNAGKKYSFTNWDKAKNDFFVRQAYDDTSGVAVLQNDIIYLIKNEDLKFGPVNRISPKGTAARTATGKVSSHYSLLDVKAVQAAFYGYHKI